VVSPIRSGYDAESEDIHTFKTGYVVTIDIRIRPSFVVCVDATHATKIVFCDSGVERIQRQDIHTSNKVKPFDGNRRGDRAAPTADGAVTASRILNAIGQLQFQHHATTMASRSVPQLNRGVANDFMNVHFGMLGMRPNEQRFPAALRC
jgi:hypothetical protein